MSSKRKPISLDAFLRRELKATGKPTYRVAVEAGIPHPVLYRYLSGRNKDPRLSTVERLLRYLGSDPAKMARNERGR